MLQEVKLIIQVFDETLEKIVQSIKDGANAYTYIRLWKEALNNPENGYTPEQQKAIEIHISDKKAIKKLIKQAREKIEKEGAAQEIIKESLASNFIGKGVIQDDKIVENKEIEEQFTTADYQVVYESNIDEQPYKFYLSPAGKMVILPSKAIPLFDSKIEGYDDLTIAEGALTGFILNGKIYKSEFIKKKHKWWFNGYVVCQEKREDNTCKRGIYYIDTNSQLQSIEERIVNKDESVLKELNVSEFASIPLIVGGTAAMKGIAMEGTLRTGGSVLLRGTTLFKLTFITLLWDFLVTPARIEVVGTGELVAKLPIDFTKVDDGLEQNPPVVIPTTIPFKMPESKGNCSVYVIYRVNKSTNNFEVSKYGITCKTEEDGTQCDTRPQSQVNYFNSRSEAPYYNN